MYCFQGIFPFLSKNVEFNKFYHYIISICTSLQINLDIIDECLLIKNLKQN